MTDLRTELDAAGDLPNGVAKSAALEGLVERADAIGDDLISRDARLRLISSYAYGGEPLKRFTPFAWLLERYDADPAFFDQQSRHHLFWDFKWIAVGALDHPAVSLEQIEDGLAQMQTRYAAAGEGLAPYLGCRFKVDSHLHGAAAAEDSYLAWVRAPRSQLSDCNACEPTARVGQLAATSRHQEAVNEARPVLEGRTTCAEQPQLMISQALESMLLVGEVQQAAHEHLRGVRLLRAELGDLTVWSRHVLACARSGRLARGLDLLEERLAEIDAPPSPVDAMWLAAAGSRLLAGLADAGQGDLMVTARPGRTGAGGGAGRGDRGVATGGNVAELGQRLTALARDLAARFDARNQSSAIGSEVQHWLDAGELPDLPLDQVSSRRGAELGARPARPRSGGAWSGLATSAHSAGSASSSSSSAPAAAAAAAAELEPVLGGAHGLAAGYQHSRRTGSQAERAAVLEMWRRIRPGAGPQAENDRAAGSFDRADAARLDAALALDDFEAAGEGDTSRLRQALLELRATGDLRLALQNEVTCLLIEAGAADDRSGLLAGLDALIAEAVTACAPPDLGCLWVATMYATRRAQELTGRAEAASPDSDRSELTSRWFAALNNGLAAFRDSDPQTLALDQRSCWALLLMEQAAELKPGSAATQLRVALDLLPPGTRARERAVVGVELAGRLADLGELQAAITLLDDAAADARTAGRTEVGAQACRLLGQIHRHTGDAEAAVRAFTQAVDLLSRTDQQLALANARRDLVHSLRAAGRPVEAAELAETALHTLVEEATALPAEARTFVDTAPAAADSDPGTVVPELPHPALARVAWLAGTLAFAAALASRELGEQAHALDLARRSSRWHRLAGEVPSEAEAEALKLAAQIEADPARSLLLFRRAADLFEPAAWQQTAYCLRMVAQRTLRVHDLAAAQVALAAASVALDQVAPEPDAESVLAWERLALQEQAVRILAIGGAADQALLTLDGLSEGYRELGDPANARDAVCLRANVLAELDRADEGLAALQQVAAEALGEGAFQEARNLGSELARLLDGLGRPDQAEAAWQRFSSAANAG